MFIRIEREIFSPLILNTEQIQAIQISSDENCWLLLVTMFGQATDFRLDFESAERRNQLFELISNALSPRIIQIPTKKELNKF